MVRGSILIVDDDHDTAILMAELLRAHDFAAFGVNSAAACRELLDREAMDVVVTDVAMPDMSGIELCHELRARNPAPRILVMSGYDSCADIAAARQAGALAYLVKPVGAAALARAIRRALGAPALGPDPVRPRDQGDWSPAAHRAAADVRRSAVKGAHPASDRSRPNT
jgi:DNA-binding response OmpR family regulator